MIFCISLCAYLVISIVSVSYFTASSSSSCIAPYVNPSRMRDAATTYKLRLLTKECVKASDELNLTTCIAVSVLVDVLNVYNEPAPSGTN